MPQITAPPGCRRLTFADGSEPVKVNRWGRAEVSDAQAKMINSMRGNGEGGLINGEAGTYGARKAPGRRCVKCCWTGYAWSMTCNRCGAETVPE